MAKETYYFPHDYIARNDDKTAALIADHGMTGYGVYWLIIEMLHEDENNRVEYNEKKLRRLSALGRIDYEVFKKIVDDCIRQYELFKLTDDGAYLYVPRVEQNKKIRAAIIEQKKAAGKAGAEKRWNKQKPEQEADAITQPAHSTTIADDSSPIAEHGKGNETKENEIKPNEIKETKEKKNKSAAQPTHSPEDLKLFENVKGWIEENAPQVNQMQQPFTIDEIIRLKKNNYSTQLFKTVLIAMHNKRGLTKRYISAYHTFVAWAKIEMSGRWKYAGK